MKDYKVAPQICYAVCFADLDQGSKMIIIFEPVLTIFFIPSVILRGRRGTIKNWLEVNMGLPIANLACPNW